MISSSKEIIVDYPYDGVSLGQGWDGISGNEKVAFPIRFEKVIDTGQEKICRILQVTERNMLRYGLDVSIEASYNFMIGKVSAKGRFSGQTEMSETFESFVTYAFIENGAIRTGSTPKDPKDPTSERGVWLADDAVELARNDLEGFRLIYGDYYVYAIHGGAVLDVAMTFRTSSREEQMQIETAMEYSGLNFDVNGQAALTIEKYGKKGQLDIYYHQLGGSGDPIPIDTAGFMNKIRDLPKLAKDDPKYFRITLKKYDTLRNWPRNQYDIANTPYKSVIRKYYEYLDLKNEIDFIKANSVQYVFYSPNLLEIQDEINHGVSDLEKILKTNVGKEANADYTIPQSATKEDYEFRTSLPLPKGFFNKNSWDNYCQDVIDKWFIPISRNRGNMYGISDPGYLSNSQIEEYRSKVHYLTVVGSKVDIPQEQRFIAWGEIQNAQKLETIYDWDGTGIASSLYIKVVPGRHRSAIVGISDNNAELVWGRKTVDDEDHKKVFLFFGSDLAYFFHLDDNPKPNSERIVGGQWNNMTWGLESDNVIYIPSGGFAFYIGK
jgi:hypothetical protein